MPVSYEYSCDTVLMFIKAFQSNNLSNVLCSQHLDFSYTSASLYHRRTNGLERRMYGNFPPPRPEIGARLDPLTDDHVSIYFIAISCLYLSQDPLKLLLGLRMQRNYCFLGQSFLFFRFFFHVFGNKDKKHITKCFI